MKPVKHLKVKKTGPVLLCIFFSVLARHSFAQFTTPPDSAEAQIWRTDCGDIVFSKVENLQTITGGMKRMEDSLTSYLQSKNEFSDGAHARLSFVVSTSSKILRLSEEKNTFRRSGLIEEFIRSHNYMWKPAVQNGMAVCAMIRFEIVVDQNKLTANIFQ